MIRINDYVRVGTKIGKVISIKEANKKWKYIVKFNKRTTHVAEWCIKKHSPNIIDLIECGDYVNGYKVINVKKLTFATLEHNGTKVHHKQCVTIKSIVTHEQFNSIKYEVI